MSFRKLIRRVLFPGTPTLALLACVAIGIMLGTGGVTFWYAEGTSYLSNDPQMCVNCHIMRDHYDSWEKASHHATANCNDCHTPHDFLGKWTVKSENGFWHSYGFTFQNFHEPIMIRERNSRVLENNCIECHRDLVETIIGVPPDPHGGWNCIHCHSALATACGADPPTETRTMPDEPQSAPPRRAFWKRPAFLYPAVIVLSAGVTAGVLMLLFNIYTRKWEARETVFRVVDLPPGTVDPAEWGKNYPRQYDSYKRTVDVERTRHGGNESFPQKRGETIGPEASKLEIDSRLKLIYNGYPFSVDYREARGHAYMLSDQDVTRRTTEFKQPGACLHCHASMIPAYQQKGREAGVADDKPREQVMKGFEVVCKMPLADARQMKAPDGKSLVAHPVSCIDCHKPETMQLQVTRPAFVVGIQELAKSDAPVPHLPSIDRWRKGNRKDGYDPSTDATRQEMRSLVCGQCHVEYYFQKDTKVVTYPWHKGLRADDIERYYEEMKFTDWTHADTGTQVLKAQHPEFEMWSQGIHARSGVSCADCHMPYLREGAIKISDHHVRSPMLNVNRSCQTCHRYPEAEIVARVEAIQGRTRELLDRSEDACVDLIRAISDAKSRGATDEQLAEARKLHRAAQWRTDFVQSENSRGFHAPQEAARVLAQAIDLARQGQLKAVTTKPSK